MQPGFAGNYIYIRRLELLPNYLRLVWGGVLIIIMKRQFSLWIFSIGCSFDNFNHTNAPCNTRLDK